MKKIIACLLILSLFLASSCRQKKGNITSVGDLKQSSEYQSVIGEQRENLNAWILFDMGKKKQEVLRFDETIKAHMVVFDEEGRGHGLLPDILKLAKQGYDSFSKLRTAEEPFKYTEWIIPADLKTDETATSTVGFTYCDIREEDGTKELIPGMTAEEYFKGMDSELRALYKKQYHKLSLGFYGNERPYYKALKELCAQAKLDEKRVYTFWGGDFSEFPRVYAVGFDEKGKGFVLDVAHHAQSDNYYWGKPIVSASEAWDITEQKLKERGVDIDEMLEDPLEPAKITPDVSKVKFG